MMKLLTEKYVIIWLLFPAPGQHWPWGATLKHIRAEALMPALSFAIIDVCRPLAHLAAGRPRYHRAILTHHHYISISSPHVISSPPQELAHS